MGFGHGPFGKRPFGRSAWARAVLFDSLPPIYRQYDEENNNVLETLVEALAPTFEDVRGKIESWSDLREPLKVRSSSDTRRSIRLGLIKDPDSKTEQRGADGLVTATRGFQSPTARFRTEDKGKTLILSGSSLLANNRAFKVAAIISSSVVMCDPPLLADAGPLKWELRALPDIPEDEIAIEVRGGDVQGITPGWVLFDGQTRFTVTHRQQFFPMGGETRLLTEREGSAGLILADGRFQAEAAFTQMDVGKPLTLAYSSVENNNGKFQIREIDATDSRIVKLWEPYTIPGADANGGVIYSLRPGSGTVQVTHEVEGASGTLGVSVIGRDITVTLATNASGVVTSTAADVVAALATNIDADALISAVATGTGLGKASISDFVTLPGASLAPDSNAIYWAVLPFPEIRIQGITPPAGIVQRENVDASISGTTVTTLTGKFTSIDVGNLLTISGSTLGSNGAYTIATVTSPSVCTITAPAPLPAESNLTWSVRTPSSLDNILDVQTSAPSLLEHLASDFALTIDERESEPQQRSWIENATQWMDLKGSAKAYELIGAISGFNAQSDGLYRITRSALDAIPATARVIVGENTVGRTGLDGRIYSSGLNFYFTAESAVFTKKDVGLTLYFRNVNNTVNEGFFEVTEFIDSKNLLVNALGALVTPENGLSGSLADPTVAWRLCRLYSKVPALRPRFDDLNVELMQSMVGADGFRIDMYAWDQAYKNSFTIAITSVSPAVAPDVPSTYVVELTGLLQGTGNYSTARVIQNAEKWQLTDSTGQIFYVETVPTLMASGPPEIHTFEVFSGQLPALGPATLTYLADDIIDCDFCRSYTAVVQLSPGSVLRSSTSNLDAALDVVNTRLMTEVRPEHVLLIPAYLDGTTAVGRSLNPGYELIEYQLANNITDTISVEDSIYVIKNDIQFVAPPTDLVTVVDHIYPSLILDRPAGSDSISVTDSITAERIIWEPSGYPLTGWWRGNYAGGIWPGTASVGTSGSRTAMSNTAFGNVNPTVGATVGGYAPADFLANASSLTAGSAGTLVGTKTGWSLWCLAKSTWVGLATATRAALVMYNPSVSVTSTPHFTLIDRQINSTSRNWQISASDGSGTTNLPSANDYNVWSLVQVRFTANPTPTFEYRVNGGSWTVHSSGNSWVPGPDGWNTIFMGAIRGGSNAGSVSLLDVATTEIVLTDADFDRVREYCNKRYGVSV